MSSTSVVVVYHDHTCNLDKPKYTPPMSAHVRSTMTKGQSRHPVYSHYTDSRKCNTRQPSVCQHPLRSPSPSSYFTPISTQRKSTVVRSIRTEPKALPDHGAIGRQVSSTSQHCAFLIVLRLPGIGTLGEHWDDLPVVELESFQSKIAKCDGFLEVGAVDPLKRAECLIHRGVVIECVWNRTS